LFFIFIAQWGRFYISWVAEEKSSAEVLFQLLYLRSGVAGNDRSENIGCLTWHFNDAIEMAGEMNFPLFGSASPEGV